DKNAHYIKNVLRLKKGDRIEIFDGKGNKYNCALQDLNSAKIISKEFSLAKETAYKVTLAQAIPNKLSKMDFIIEKSTELGVERIVPVAAGRSVIKTGKGQRWQSLASEASKQCGRPVIPQIKDVMPVKEAISVLKNSDIKLFACIDKDTIKLQDVLNVGESLKSDPTISIFIGPEGDFTPDEIKHAKDNGFKLVSLGERVLRTETAGLYILSILDYILG
ncbi:MAG: 16S rRNA methyltransferase, partial [Candidatus Omnitrophica bacterium CG_4_9_14_0_2_um_filter_43_12]